MQPAFPGMNPYLEDPDLWTEVHAWLIVLLARLLNPLLPPKYRAAIEKLCPKKTFSECPKKTFSEKYEKIQRPSDHSPPD